jgi:hypothetical protein
MRGSIGDGWLRGPSASGALRIWKDHLLQCVSPDFSHAGLRSGEGFQHHEADAFEKGKLARAPRAGVIAVAAYSGQV